MNIVFNTRNYYKKLKIELTKIQPSPVTAELGYHSKTFHIGLTGLDVPNIVKVLNPTEITNVAKQENQVVHWTLRYYNCLKKPGTFHVLNHIQPLDPRGTHCPCPK